MRGAPIPTFVRLHDKTSNARTLCRRLSAGIFSGDITLQLLNRLFLPGDDPLHEIADGQHTLDALTLHDRQVANTTGGHYGHALVDRLLWSHKNNRAAHDLLDQSLFRRPPLEYDFTGIVTL